MSVSLPHRILFPESADETVRSPESEIPKVQKINWIKKNIFYVQIQHSQC